MWKIENPNKYYFLGIKKSIIIKKSYINVPGITMQCSGNQKDILFNDFSDITVWKYVKVIIIMFYI